MADDYAHGDKQLGRVLAITGGWLGAGMGEPCSSHLEHLAPDLASLPDQLCAGLDCRAGAGRRRLLPSAQAVNPFCQPTGHGLAPSAASSVSLRLALSQEA